MTAPRRLVPFLLLSHGLLSIAAGAAAQAPPKKSGEPPPSPSHVVALTSSSSAAKDHFIKGLRLQDVGLGPEARGAFLEAVGADPAFALAHLYAAFNANTTKEYRTHLDHAVALADKVSSPERLMIQIERRGFANDPAGQLELAKQLVAATPRNPRSLQTLANAQFALGRPADARATLERAIKAAPRFAQVHIQLGNSYITGEPRDVAKGLAHIRHAVELEPNEAYTHDFMGDAYRANNDLTAARSAYTRMTELAPTRALAFQQRGHVNSFLGKFAEARADYDRAIALGDVQEKASYGVFRALVHGYAGDPAAAERELEDMVRAIDGMDLPSRVGPKIFALTTQLQIALFHGHLDVASRAVDRLRMLWREQAEMGGTPEWRRSREANIIYVEGMLAARKGEYAAARAKAAEFMKVVEPDKNPRKNEGAHDLLGMADLLEKKYATAAAHFAQSNPDDNYIAYHRALALEGAGKTAEARTLFKRAADNNFSNAATALTKRDAARRAK